MTISKLTDDLKISSLKEMISPSDLIAELPLSESAIKTVIDCRSEIIKILNGEDNRLMLIVGPCSIHDVCLLYTSPSPRDRTRSRMPSSA